MLPAPTAPSEGSAGLKDTFRRTRPSSPSSPAQASLPIEPLPRERSLDHLPDRVTRRLACLSIIAPDPKVKAIRCSAALLGMISVGVPLCRSARKLPDRVAQTGRSSLPAPLPDWPRNTPRSITLPVGGDRSFRHPPLSFLPLPAFRLEAGTSVPITLVRCTSNPSRGSKKCGNRPVDNGDIGNNRRNLCHNR